MKTPSPLTPHQAKRFYDDFGAKQDWQSSYENEALSLATLLRSGRRAARRLHGRLG